MGLVNTIEMLKRAQKGCYAIAAFNVENMEMIQAVIQKAEELQAPVILQTTPSTIKYAGLEYLYVNAKVAAQRAGIPVALHLDHGSSYQLVIQALACGYTSIMIDGSKEDYETNIAVSRRVVEACSTVGIPVEAELGTVGGKEDGTEAQNCYTDPDKAQEFVERTGISSMAVAIGTAHGIYKGTPKLDIERLVEIRKAVDIPLVLHGASGVPGEAVRRSIERGICKVNYATELRIAYSEGVRKLLTDKPEAFDPKEYGRLGTEFVKRIVGEKIELCGCAYRAEG